MDCTRDWQKCSDPISERSTREENRRYPGYRSLFFLLRTLRAFGLGKNDIELIDVQHADGCAALEQLRVEAWAGLDPYMASSEQMAGSNFLYRNTAYNSYGFLNISESFLKKYPKIVRIVLEAYERARKWILTNPEAAAKVLADAENLSTEITRIQLTRNDLTTPFLGRPQMASLADAAHLLVEKRLVDPGTNINKVVHDLRDQSLSISVIQSARGCMNPLANSSLKTRLTSFILLLFVTSILLLSYNIITMLRDDMQSQLGKQQYASLKLLADNLDDDITDRVSALRIIALELSHSKEALTRETLQERIDARPIFIRLFNAETFILHADGSILYSSVPSLHRDGMQYRDLAFVATTLQEGKETISPVLFDPALQMPTLAMAAPIRDLSGKVVAALVGVTSLSQPNFIDRITNSPFGETGGYLLIAPKQRIVAQSSDKSHNREPLPAMDRIPGLDQLLEGQKHSVVFSNAKGLEVLASAQPLSTTGLSLLSLLPTTEAFAAVRDLYQRIVFITITLTLAMAWLIWWTLHRQLLPMTTLTKKLMEMSDLCQSRQFLVIMRRDEIGVLAETFNRLLATLWNKEDALEQHRHDLAQLVADRTTDLESTTKMLRSVLNTMPGRVFWKDCQGVYQGCNPLFAKDTGFHDPQELIGHRDTDLPWHVLTESIENIDQALMTSVLSEWWNEESRPIASGEVLCIRICKVPLRSDQGEIQGVLGVYEDITHAKALQNDLLRTQQELAFQKHALDEHAIVSAADVRGKITYINDKFVTISGYSREELIGKTHRTVKSDEHPLEFYKEMWRTIAQGRTWHGEVKNQTKEGSHYWVQATIVPFLDDDGKPFKYISIRTDITAIKTLEANLITAKKQAEEAARAKSDFLANMSHEIRTPMNAIIGLSHLCLQTDLTTRQKDYIRKVHHAATSLLRIINDILDFSKIEAGRLDMESTDFTLEEVLGTMASMTTQKAEEKHLEFLMETAVNIPPSLVGDPLRLGQVLINLTNNAIKFTEQGEVAVTTELLEKDEGAVRLQFVIRDTGVGITEEQQSRLFTAFSQADTSTTRKYGGTGLGLTISKKLIELMGGSIRVESMPGRGSRFVFDVRLGISQHSVEKWLLPSADLRGLKTLAVDDNESARNVIADYLASFTFQVTKARDGKEAIVLVQEADMLGEPYDLIVMDYMMPEMDGITAAAKIRHDLYLQKIPVLIIATAYGEESVVKRATLEAEVDGFLVKPINQSLLFESIMEAFGRSDAHSKKGGVIHTGRQDFLAVLSGAIVLLVEDNEINQQVARELLEQANITVLLATNGREAVNMVARERLDGVLMDVQMPIMDGLSATREIRKDPRFSTLPILAMTANAMSGDRDLCLEAGMQDHIAKPIDPHDMFTTLARWITPASPKPFPASPALPEGQTPSEEDTGTVPEIPGINTKNGLQRMGGKTKKYLDLLAKFLTNQRNAMAKLALALENNDTATAERIAHTLNGVAGTIGATLLQEKAGRIESALRSGTPLQPIDSTVTETRDTLENICLSLVPLFPQDAVHDTLPVGQPAPPEGLRQQRELFRKASRQLSIYDSDVENTLATLREYAFTQATLVWISRIEKEVAHYDFEAATESLHQCLTALGNPSCHL